MTKEVPPFELWSAHFPPALSASPLDLIDMPTNATNCASPGQASRVPTHTVLPVFSDSYTTAVHHHHHDPHRAANSSNKQDVNFEKPQAQDHNDSNAHRLSQSPPAGNLPGCLRVLGLLLCPAGPKTQGDPTPCLLLDILLLLLLLCRRLCRRCPLRKSACIGRCCPAPYSHLLDGTFVDASVEK